MLNSKLLRVWLAEHDRTQQWLAEAAGIGHATLNRALKGKMQPQRSTIRLLAQATGIPEDQLDLRAEKGAA